MSIQSDFFALLGPVFAGQLYRNVAVSPVQPYAVYSRVTGVEGVTLDDNGGTGNETASRLQLDIYALVAADADSLATAAKAALKGWSVSNVVVLESDAYESDTKLHRVMLDIATIHQ